MLRWADVIGCEPVVSFKVKENVKMSLNTNCTFLEQNFMEWLYDRLDNNYKSNT